MPDQLSQQEIDALLDTFSATPGGPRPGKGQAELQPYDFSHPDLLSRDQVRSLRTLHEGYAQILAKRLSTEFLTNVSATVVSIDHLTYAEFLLLVPSPTVLAVIEVPELQGAVALEVNPNVTFAFIDRLLGGEGKALGRVRALTAIEQGLMQRVLQKCCQELSAVWAPLMKLEFQLQSIESNPELARVVGPNEMAILVALELRMNEVSGMLNLCLPYVVMEPAIQALGQGSKHMHRAQAGSGQSRRLIERALPGAIVAVDVDLGAAELTIAELMALEPGDVLRWTGGKEAGAIASIEGVPRLVGEPGRSRGHAALRVNAVKAGRDARKEE